MARNDPAKALRRWRKTNGLTRRAVAAALDVTEGTIYNWEDGKGAPNVVQLQKLEQAWPGLTSEMGL